jgi:hypothetical protein
VALDWDGIVRQNAAAVVNAALRVLGIPRMRRITTSEVLRFAGDMVSKIDRLLIDEQLLEGEGHR